MSLQTFKQQKIEEFKKLNLGRPLGEIDKSDMEIITSFLSQTIDDTYAEGYKHGLDSADGEARWYGN